MQYRVPLLIAALMVSTPALAADGKSHDGGPPATADRIPHGEDETSLLRLKANPQKYRGKTVTICGGVTLADYYNFGYTLAETTHFSLQFFQAGRTTGDDDAGPEANLYLRRSETADQQVISPIVDFAERHPRHCRLARVKVTIAPDRPTPRWDMLEVLDVQFYDWDRKRWDPWTLHFDEKAPAMKRTAGRRGLEEIDDRQPQPPRAGTKREPATKRGRLPSLAD